MWCDCEQPDVYLFPIRLLCACVWPIITLPVWWCVPPGMTVVRPMLCSYDEGPDEYDYFFFWGTSFMLFYVWHIWLHGCLCVTIFAWLWLYDYVERNVYYFTIYIATHWAASSLFSIITLSGCHRISCSSDFDQFRLGPRHALLHDFIHWACYVNYCNYMYLTHVCIVNVEKYVLCLCL